MLKVRDGFFITMEGGEASGKTTLTKQLGEKLTQMGYTVVTVREPGGTPYGNKARQLFLEMHHELVPATEIGLLFTMKAQLLKTVIEPALQQGCVVICDRYTDTLLAYQHHAKGHSRRPIMAMSAAFETNKVPDLTLLIDLPVDVAMQRIQRRRDEGGDYNSFDSAVLEFHQKIRDGFHYEIVEHWKGLRKTVTIDSNREYIDVFVDVCISVREALLSRTYTE